MGTYINRCCERSHATAASYQIRPRCARLLAKPQYFSPPNEVCCWPGRRCGARTLPRVCGTERRCCGARAPTIRRHHRGARAANKAQAPLRGKGAGRKQELARGRQILSDSPSDLAITSAAQVLPYVFTAVRGISQSCCTARTSPMPSKGNPTT